MKFVDPDGNFILPLLITGVVMLNSPAAYNLGILASSSTGVVTIEIGIAFADAGLSMNGNLDGFINSTTPPEMGLASFITGKIIDQGKLAVQDPKSVLDGAKYSLNKTNEVLYETFTKPGVKVMDAGIDKTISVAKVVKEDLKSGGVKRNGNFKAIEHTNVKIKEPTKSLKLKLPKKFKTPEIKKITQFKVEK